MEPNTKNLIFGIFFVLLGISLLIMSILDIRTYQDTDNQTIKDNIDFINTCSHIIMIVSAFVVLTGIVFMIRSKRQEFLEFFFSLSPKIKSFIMIAIGLLILIVGILQRVKINNILPDMSNENAVKSYNDNHTVSASSVLGSNMGIISSGIIFLLAGIIHFFMNRDEEVKEEVREEVRDGGLIKAPARIQYEKDLVHIADLEKSLEDIKNSGKYDEYYIAEQALILKNISSAVENRWQVYQEGIRQAIHDASESEKANKIKKVSTPLPTPLSKPLQSKPSTQPSTQPVPNLWGQ